MTIKQTGGIFGRNPTFNDVDIDGDLTVAGDLTVQGTTITVDSATAQSIVLGDNDKMTFGDGADLQIYSDGANSIVKESGVGSLNFQATNINFKDATDTDFTARFLTGADVRLYYDGDQKLATTSTGVDVTGTITSDGLTVDNSGTAILITNGDGLTQLGKFVGDATYGFVVEGKANNNLTLKTNANGAGEGIYFTDTSDNKRMFIDGTTGDISFYEDTGTTPKFFWDASEESVTIGTTVNSQVPLNVSAATVGSSNAIAFLRNSSADGNGLVVDVTNTPTDYVADFRIGNTSKVRIDSSGNVGIGTSSTDATHKLKIYDASSPRMNFQNSVTGTAGSQGMEIGLNSSQQGFIWNYSNTPIYFATNNAERMRIDSSGNLLIGGTVTPTSSAKNLVLHNGTAPTGNATDGVILYAEDVSSSSELKVRDEAGNVTTLSPHNFDLIPEGPSEDMAWSYYSERDGKRINVDMLKAIRLLEQISGEKLVHMV
jgi:hypothetical protein